MSDVFTREKRSAVMARVRGKDTKPELAVRAILQGLPGRPDIVMKGRRIAVFVHGCFWHGHDCPRGARRPRANADYWISKIGRNRTRDAASAAALAANGWRVITVWECAMKAPDFGDRLLAAVRGQAAAVSISS